eukprot:765370-Hanusia_phi.AAC.3
MLMIEMCGRACSGRDWVGLLEACDIPKLARNFSIDVHCECQRVEALKSEAGGRRNSLWDS